MNSLLCQKGADFEIVLIDDGSTDNSGKMCDAYAKQYPNIVRVVHKANEGLLMTRRRGFKEAKGDWFICIDSDDYTNPNLLEKVVDAVNKHNPDLVMYNFEYVNDLGEVSKSRLNIEDGSVYTGKDKLSIYTHKLLTDDINNMWSKAIKRDILDLNKDYSNCGIRNMCEDAVQVLPLFTNAEKIVYLNTPLYNYRKGDESITSNSTYQNWLAIRNCFLITEKYLDIWEVSDELRRKFYTHNCEALSNFTRWLFSQSEDNLPESYASIIHMISGADAFQRSLDMYDKSYAKTSYLKVSVPIIMKYIKKESIKGLHRYFVLESRILAIK